MASKPLSEKNAMRQKTTRQEKIESVLVGLVEYYIKTAKPVGSNTLKETGFQEVSSATIRNYFAELEEKGYLKQHHTSGGRVPTPEAYRLYARYCQDELEREVPHESFACRIAPLESHEMKEIALFLQQACEGLSDEIQCAAFLSAPRFDQDFVIDIKLVGIDSYRVLAVLLTSFGQIYTETLSVLHKISTFSLKRIEEYFHSRLTGLDQVESSLSSEELELALRFYKEIMARYIVNYVNFSREDVYRSGFSRLLRYLEFQEAENLTSSLSIFENETALRALVREAIKTKKSRVWVADDLFYFLTTQANCTVITAPYHIANKNVGAIGVIGPMRMPYKHNLALINAYASEISHYLEKNLYKHKITYRTPQQTGYEIGEESRKLLSAPQERGLLEHQEHYE